MELIITEYDNRKNPSGRVVHTTWDDLVNRLREPEITMDTLAEYSQMTNEERTECKDVGGYIGGECEGGRRSKATVLNRYLLTIDADDAKVTDEADYDSTHDVLCVVHSTHTSTEDNPRYRWVFPLARPVTTDEYRVLIGIVKHWVGAEGIDETTDQPERLMFWPSICLDGKYVCAVHGHTVLDPDELLEEIDIPQEAVVARASEPVEHDDQFIIGEGRRNRTVFGFAATLRGAGLSYQDIRSMLNTYNENHCDPPLPDFELDTIAHSVCGRYEAGASIHASLRDAWDDFNDLGEWKESKKEESHISVESAADLCARDVAPPKYVVEGLISSGITILASPPKFGKSWLCMGLGTDVANGDDFLGMKTHKCGVLYLALEDGDFRLKERSLKVAGGKSIPANFFLAKHSPTLNEGLLPELDKCLRENAGIGLVIIDTLQKVRGVAGKTEGVYGYDYRELGQLHEFALNKNIAIVLVHHLRKGDNDTDFVERLNGSTGVSGAADSIIVLARAKRGSDETKMNITGRDVVERTLVLQMNWGTYRWVCLGDERDVEKDRDESEFYADPIVRTLLFHMEEEEDYMDEDDTSVSWEVSLKDFSDAIYQYTGFETESGVRLGKRIKSLSAELLEREGITCEPTKSKTARGYLFKREV